MSWLVACCHVRGSLPKVSKASSTKTRNSTNQRYVNDAKGYIPITNCLSPQVIADQHPVNGIILIFYHMVTLGDPVWPPSVVQPN